MNKYIILLLSCTILCSQEYKIEGTGTRQEDGSIKAEVTLTEVESTPTSIVGTWIETGPHNALTIADNFELLTDEIVSKEAGSNIHAHFSEIFSLPLEFYSEIFVTSTATREGCGITFLSDYPNSDSYLRVRFWSSGRFSLNKHPDAQVNEDPSLLKPVENNWYAVRVKVSDKIYVKIWLLSDIEPTIWSTAPLEPFTTGRIGLWAYGSSKYRWRNLTVNGLKLLWDKDLVLNDPDPIIPDPIIPPVIEPDPIIVEVPLSTSFIEQNGIKWYFENEVVHGTFINGDPWVLGPVNLIQILPGFRNGSNGTMIDPMPSNTHGFDTRVAGFNQSLNLILPVRITGTHSVVSTISSSSSTAPAPGDPALSAAAVLTVVDSIPPADAFRPAYGGLNKRLLVASSIQRDLLGQLIPVGTPDLIAQEERTTNTWLDVKMEWSGRFLHPSNNMPDYGRDMSSAIHDAILRCLCIDYSDKLLFNVLQIGIDFNGLVQNGAKWGGNVGGGHGVGRKWPILFAGIILNDPEMLNLGFDYSDGSTFQEDCQVFFDVDGTPSWGSRHCSKPEEDDLWTGYRVCCTSNTWLSAGIGIITLNVESLWNHPSFIPYLYSYSKEMNDTYGPSDSRTGWTKFARMMWATYSL